MNASQLPAAGRFPTQMRAMRPQDLEDVFEIETRAYEFPWTLGIFRDCMQSGYGCWVLTENDKIIGYGVLSVAAGEAHILNVAISPKAQGRGHGRHLVSRLVDLARWHRAERIFLEVRPSNGPAQHIYESLGFNEIGRRPGYYPAPNGRREDAIVMGMELLPPEA